MKKILLLLALFPLVSYSDHPTKCPDPELIKEIGINERLFEDSDSHWYGGRSALAYGTDYKWTFVITHIKAPTNDLAYKIANESLKFLSLQSGPTVGRTPDEVYCLYSAGFHEAVAISPPFIGTPPLSMINNITAHH